MKYNEWKFEDKEQWDGFTEATDTANIFRGSKFNIGKGNQVATFVTFNPELSETVNPPENFPDLPPDEDKLYRVTQY